MSLSTLTTRAMLLPLSPPGRPQPRSRSSTVCGSSAGTLSRAARTIVRGQVVGPQVLQRALVGPADRRAGGGDDDGLGHDDSDLGGAGPLTLGDGSRRPASMGACATSTSARCAGRTSTCSATSTTWCTSTTSRRRGSTCSGSAPRDDRADDLAEGVVVVRHEVTYLRPLNVRLPPGEDRELGHGDPGGQLHDQLRGRRRQRGRAGGAPAGDDRAHAVRLQDRASAPHHRRGARRARGLPRAARRPAGPGAPARPAAGAAGSTSRSTSGSPTSTSTATSTT